MANPLDEITGYESVPADADGRRRVVIRTPGVVGPDGSPEGNNLLTQALTPEQPAQQPWTMDDLLKGLAALKEHVTTGEFSPGTKIGNRLFGTGGEERYQTWPEKMVRSGVGAAGNALSSLEPVTSEQLIAPAMDMAGLAGGSALIERPGAATLGSGPVRPAARTTMAKISDIPEGIPHHTDADGFTHFIIPRKPGDKLWRDANDPWEQRYEPLRKGHKYVMSPEGEIRENGYWMDFPEKGWEANGVDLHQDYNRKPSKAEKKQFETYEDWTSGATAYGKLPITERLAMENKQQATAYAPLRELFQTRSPVKLFSDTQQPGAAVSAAAQASKGPAPVFYSALEHAAINAAQDVMTPQQWLGYLKNQPGVKQEELQWTGIGDWLNGQKGKVSKADVQRYLDEHKVEIKDVAKEGSKAYEDLSEAELERVKQDYKETYGLEHDEPVVWDDVRQHYDDMMVEDGEGINGTKYSSYQLPGGENYREHLLTLPDRPMISPEARLLSGFNTTSKIKTLEDAQNARLHNQQFAASVEGMTNEQVLQAAKEVQAFDKNVPYRSSHWDEPNVLAHVRTNDRTIDGKKALHIEEIQSDWHQQGRKQGYKTKLSDAEQAELDALRKKMSFDVPEAPTTAELARFDELRIRDEGAQKVPNAPFKTSWPELALKRMIRKAAEEGYDRISWTPGEAQAARYDLSKTLSGIRAYKNNDGTIKLVGKKQGQDVGGFHHFGDHISIEKLPDYIGKDAAEKLLKAEEQGASGGAKYHELVGTDLKVGGEGMREFYDKMLPKMVEKIGKAHGVKVKQTAINHMEPKQNKDGKWYLHDKEENGGFATKLYDTKEAAIQAHAQPVHYFDIPQSLRNHAIGKGFPLYMQGIPFPLVPVDHDPFKKKERK